MVSMQARGMGMSHLQALAPIISMRGKTQDFIAQPVPDIRRNVSHGNGRSVLGRRDLIYKA
jgi:hypothetical protein